MRDDLIARLIERMPVVIAGARMRHTEIVVTPDEMEALIAALTARMLPRRQSEPFYAEVEGETAPATDHAAARTKLREWVQEDAMAAQGEPAPAPVTHRPAYNHTRGDSHLTPCPECAAASSLPAAEGLEQLARIVAEMRSAVAVARDYSGPAVREVVNQTVEDWAERAAAALRAVAEGRR